jgi:hypothetical protein
MSLHDNVLSYLWRQAPEALGFWTVTNSTARPDVLAVCDTFYSLKLIDRLEMLAPDAAMRFARLLCEHRLAGGIGHGQGNALGVHKTAYALGVLNFLDAHGQPVQQDALRENGWRKSELLDHRHRPRWPWYFTHHAWRVGHWIGGIPAIILSLWRLAPRQAAQNRFPPPEIVLGSSDTLIDRDTGLFRAYQLEPVQRVFRALYRMRHDPDAGDLGGIAHLHWGNYAAGRLPYKAAPALFDRTWALLDQRRPFMERVPYCLDFDVLHLARTAMPSDDHRAPALTARVIDFADDIHRFYDTRLDRDYALHKLPGGLAALHECALTAGAARVPGLDIVPVDVAREAFWI